MLLNLVKVHIRKGGKLVETIKLDHVMKVIVFVEDIHLITLEAILECKEDISILLKDNKIYATEEQILDVAKVRHHLVVVIERGAN